MPKYLLNEGEKKLGVGRFKKDYKIIFKKKKINTIKKTIFLSIDSHHNHNNWSEENYIKLINILILKKYRIFLNFSPNNKVKFKKTIRMFNKKSVKFTYKLSFEKIIRLIAYSQFIIGNESGPVCLGAAFDKKVLSLYNPKTTPKSSKVIKKDVVYINTTNKNYKNILSKIFSFLS